MKKPDNVIHESSFEDSKGEVFEYVLSAEGARSVAVWEVVTDEFGNKSLVSAPLTAEAALSHALREKHDRSVSQNRD